jgi:hypothetical protein
MVLLLSLKIKRFCSSLNLSSRIVLIRGFWVNVTQHGLVVWNFSLEMDCYVN